MPWHDLFNWEHPDNIRSGAFCIFNQHFFHQFGDLNQYSVFQPEGTHIFELTDEQIEKTTAIYERMFEEINSDYLHKYDVLRNLVFDLLHFAMKLQPTTNFDKQQIIESYSASGYIGVTVNSVTCTRLVQLLSLLPEAAFAGFRGKTKERWWANGFRQMV